MARRPRLERLLRRTALALALAMAATYGFWLLIPEYDRPDLGEIVQYLTNPKYVVNAPIAYSLTGVSVGAPEHEQLAQRIRVADEGAIALYAGDLSHVRFLAPTAGGFLVASQALKGRVVVLEPDRDGDGRSDGRRLLRAHLQQPHGLALFDGWLYVAETTRISRVRFDEETGRESGPWQEIATLPDQTGHNLRPIAFGPDGWLYTALGSECNACGPKSDEIGTILRMRPDGSRREIHARGFRNVVDFDWHPATGEMYATEVGRDYLGDDLPPEELNRIVAGAHYGYPFEYGERVRDLAFEAPPNAEPPRETRGPAHQLAAHSTPLGMTFLRDPARTSDRGATALVALHGSWNRSKKVGYEVVALRWRDDGSIEQLAFAAGFEQDGDVIGRPVDVVEGPGGDVFISDDYAGAIYRVTWRE